MKNNVEPNCCSKWIAKLNCDISWKCCFQKILKKKKKKCQVKVASNKNCPSNPSHKRSPHENGNC